jgi:hypothetical protein
MSSSNQVQASSYTVLYYKRKATKVHKSKGVSKKDGVLSILPPPQSRVTLKDGNNVVFQGILYDIAKSADTLQEEELLKLGAYEVEVFEKQNGSSASLAGGNKSTSSKASLLSRPTKAARRPLHPSCRPLLPKKATARTTTYRGMGAKRFHANGRSIVRPPQPKSTLDDSSSSEDELEELVAKENKQRPAIKRGFSNKKPLGTLSKVRKLATTKTCTTTAARTTTSEATKFFPNAIGNPDVPHSIKSVLKQHQISGVSFLWNCLTGMGKAALASAHVPDTQVFKGIILADGMYGLYLVVELLYG